MIGSLRKHQSMVWIIAIPFVIVSLVAFYSSTGPAGRGRGGDLNLGSINGRAISRDEYASASRQVHLQALFRTGKVPQTEQEFQQLGMDLKREIYNRILVDEAIRHHRIDVSPEASAKFLRSYLVGEKGTLDLATYNQILANVSKQLPGITDQDLTSYARSEVGVRHMAAVFGGSGSLVTPAEAEVNFRKAHEEMLVEAALVNRSNFLAQVQADPVAISNYFLLNQSFYRQPEQRSVTYAFIPITNFLAEADAQLAKLGTNVANGLEREFTAMGTNALIDPDTKLELTKPQALERIRNRFREGIAGGEARKVAATLIYDIAEGHIDAPYKAGLFEQAAAKTNLTVLGTLPFERSAGPLGINAEGFADAAFSLTPEKPVSARPVLSEKGAYVLLLKQVVPARTKTFEAVQTEVVADFRREESMKLARNAGDKFALSLTNSPAATNAAGFAAAAKAAGLTVVTVPKFSLATEALPESGLPVDVRVLRAYASGLQPGASSAFVPLADGGFVLHLLSRQPVDPAKLKEELPAYIQRLREQRLYYGYNDWMSRQATELRLVPGQL